MAAITSNGTGGGNSNVGASWAGGVAPVEGDKVTIAATDTITLIGTQIWGDDTTSAVTVNGVLKWDRAANSSLQVKGTIAVAATGTADMGTSASPIPNGVTATLRLNYSAALAANKYTMTVADGGKFYVYGYFRTRNTVNTANISAGATSFVVADGTGWQVGDSIILAETDGTPAHYDLTTATSVTPGAGTTATIGCAALTYAHAYNSTSGIGCPIGNLTSNVVITAHNASFPSTVTVTHGASTAANLREFRNGLWTGVLLQLSGVGAAQNNTNAVITSMSDNAHVGPNVSGGICVNFNGGHWQSLVQTNGAFFAASGTSTFAAMAYNSNPSNATGCVVYYIPNYCVYLPAALGGTLSSCKFWAAGVQSMSGSFLTTTFSACQFHALPTGAGNALFAVNAQTAVFSGCSLFSSNLPGSPAFWGWVANSGSNGYITGTLVNCNEGTPTSPWQNQSSSIVGSYLYRQATGSDSTKQTYYTPAANQIRDNSTYYSGPSSLRFDTVNTALQSTKALTVPTQSGVAVTVRGRVQVNATYGASNLPTVTLSGLGITPQVFTATNTPGTWQEVTLTATQSTGSAGNLTLTLACQGGATSAQTWFDGFVDGTFVQQARFYGYEFSRQTSITQVADTVAGPATEATAAALTGIAINYGTKTVTITSSVTALDLYMYAHYDLTRAANNTQDEFITSVDGVSFTLASGWSIVNNGSITGTGDITLTGAGTYSGSGTSAINIYTPAGTYTNIVISGITSGSRVQVYDVTAAAELFNGVVAATSKTVPVTWTTDHSIRIRAAYVSGTTAKAPYETTGTLGTNGLAVTIAQVADTVYGTNAIDGSTCTEFSADYPHVQVDVSDPDGTTTIQRLYAWYCYNLTTSGGIASFFDGMLALDVLNYEIQAGVLNLQLDNVSATPVIITGGYLFRSDGQTIIATGSGSIQMDPGRAYQPPSGVNLTSILGKPLTGNGVVGDEFHV